MSFGKPTHPHRGAIPSFKGQLWGQQVRQFSGGSSNSETRGRYRGRLKTPPSLGHGGPIAKAVVGSKNIRGVTK